ncbi:hypothetical protein R1flu_027253 [Riccia fluitans]|uniref:Uncharacterized protein n=1 Tax=Riccia fluitans TaxID=41844 RepID=A0ABD1XIT2_9MARC
MNVIRHLRDCTCSIKADYTTSQFSEILENSQIVGLISRREICRFTTESRRGKFWMYRRRNNSKGTTLK